MNRAMHKIKSNIVDKNAIENFDGIT